MIRNSNALRIMALIVAATLFAYTASQADEEVTVPVPLMEDLGEQRYRIGEIIVDKKAGEFSVPGKVLHLNAALEYLAVSTDGMKGYESLLELSTSATNFNLACILIGLDEKNSVKPRYQFDDRKPEGQAVAITLTWQKDGKTMTVSGANAMTAGEESFDDDSWVYIGSSTLEDGQLFMADMTGTLIGFVHDPASVIEHINGGGIGAYGLLTGDAAVLPQEGAAISLTVSLVRQ